MSTWRVALKTRVGAGRMPRYLQWFETIVVRNPAGRRHVVAGKPSHAKLSLLQLVEGLRYAFPRAARRSLARTPAVVALHDRVAAYLRSERRLPFNEQGIFRRYPEPDIDQALPGHEAGDCRKGCMRNATGTGTHGAASVPACVAEITLAWLDSALRRDFPTARLRGLTATRIRADHGFASEVHRLALPAAPSTDRAADWFADRRAVFLQRYPDSLQGSARHLLDRIGPRVALAYRRLQGSRSTLLHRDLHLDNVLFDRVTDRPVILDWALIARGSPALDLAAVVFELADLHDTDAVTDH
jgi:hypothetical protein